MLLLLDDDGPSPAFSANFLSGVLPAGLTYTNSSTTRTYFGSDGLLKTAVANEAIFEYNPVTLALLGMRLEMEQRTNLATNSEGAAATWTISNVTNAAATIAGFSDSLAFGDNSVQRSSRKTISHTTGLAYTVSVFVQMDDGLAPVLGLTTTSGDFYLYGPDGGVCTVNPTITLIHGSIYRVSAGRTATTTASTSIGPIKTTTQSARTFRIAGIQVEAAASVSSYIQTAGAAVTRQPDVLTATSISPWFNASEGTVVFEGIASDFSVNRGMFCFSDGTNNTRIAQRVTPSGGATNFFTVEAGSTQASVSITPGAVVNTIFKTASRYFLNDTNSAINGTLGTADTVCTVPPGINALRLGDERPTIFAPFMGYARRFDYYRTRFPDAQIQGMSRV